VDTKYEKERKVKAVELLCLKTSCLFTLPVLLQTEFDVCVIVHHIWKWRGVPTWCNNCDLLS